MRTQATLKISRVALLAIVYCVLPLTVNKLHAEIRLPALISDGMVLQRDSPMRIWGGADPGEHVAVTLNGRSAASVADAQGLWAVTIGPMDAGGPFSLVIAGRNKITIHDVLIGEVWICSGQSNMAMTVGPTRPPYFTGVNNYQEELQRANHPLLRLFTVDRNVARSPQADVRGYWTAARSESVNDFSAVGYFFGRELLASLSIPVGIINASLGSTTAENWMSRSALEAEPEFRSILDTEAPLLASYASVYRDFERDYQSWKHESEVAEEAGKPVPSPPKMPSDPRQDASRPAGLFNGMIAPLSRYRIKGVVWYQGESNTDRPVQYRKLFPALIKDWRRAWGEGDFPFLYVQLASWGIDYFRLNFPELREAQTMALALPNTAMVVTTDIGDGTDGHPKNKQDIGYRLGLAAQAVAYHRDVIYEGPMFDSMSVEGNRVRVRFKHATGGLIAKNWPPGYRSGFEVAGEDRKFVEALVKIEGETIVAYSDLVKAPVAVRFNWKENPWYHLYNHAGLPAVPFRTDDWSDVNPAH